MTFILQAFMIHYHFADFMLLYARWKFQMKFHDFYTTELGWSLRNPIEIEHTACSHTPMLSVPVLSVVITVCFTY